jgi:hypothetical protein
VPKTTKEMKLVEDLTINIPNTEEGQWLQEELLQTVRYHCAEGIKGCSPENLRTISNLLMSILDNSVTSRDKLTSGPGPGHALD